MSKRKISALAIMVAAMMLGCSDAVAPPRAATIMINSAADQEGFAGDFAPENPEILVLDSDGKPVAGVVVQFAVTAGGGTVSNTTTISGPQGRASAGAWTLGRSLGLNTVVGSVDGIGSIQFTAHSVPVPAGTFQLVTIDGSEIPWTYSSRTESVVGGTFTLASTKAYSFALRIRTYDGEVMEDDTSGKFFMKWPSRLSFLSEGDPWAEGTLVADTLIVSIWGLDDAIHLHRFVRQ